MEFIPIGKRSNIYPNIVYTPTDVSKFEVDTSKTTTENPLDWAKNLVSPKSEIKVVDDNSKTKETDTSGSDYLNAWKSDNKPESKENESKEDSKDEKKNPAITYKGKGFDDFKENYKKAGIDPAKFDFFASIAKHESNFNPTVQNKAGAPAFGYFQFMQDGKKWNNISKFAGVDIQTFRNNPILQIKAAEKLANAFLSQFTDEDKKRARELGYSDSALVRGAWMGGVGGVRNFLYKGINASDNHWDKKTKKGSNVKAAMDRGNNYFKKGGILKTR